MLVAMLVPGVLMAQGYSGERPWGRLPYNPAPQYADEQPKRYNPWTQMREAKRLPPPDYRGEADDNAPKYHEPDPTYRELPKQYEELSDPRAHASPWSEHYSMPGYGYVPPYPAGGLQGGPGYAPYNGFNGVYPFFSPWSWGAPAGKW
jgi:hypothetical protein